MGLQDEPLRIGLMFARTPQPRNWAGLECIEAAHAAVRMLEDAGEVSRGQVVLLDGDVHDAESGLAEARRHVAAGARVLLGTIVSERVIPAATYAASRGVLYWEAVAASTRITESALPNFFRVNVDCVRYGEDMLRFATDVLAPRSGRAPADLRIAVLFQPREFAVSLVEVIRRAAERRGMRISLAREVAPPGDDLRAALTETRATDPDLLIAALWSPLVPRVYLEAAGMGGVARAYMGTGASALGQYMSGLGEPGEAILAAGTPHIGAMATDGLAAEARRDLERWSALASARHSDRTSVDRDLTVMALTTLIRHVLPRASSWDLADLRRAARSVDLPVGSSILGYGVRFSGTGDNERSFTAIMQWQRGRLVTVDPPLIANAPPVIA